MPKKVTTYEKVAEFHRVFGHPVQNAPLIPSVKRMKLRANLILEEGGVELILALGGRDPKNAHLARAAELVQRAIEQINMAQDYEFNDVDLVEVADALGDNDYVTAGAALEFGIPHDAVVSEIHRSNMTKTGEDGKPIYNDAGKIMKGPNYEPPQIAAVLGLDVVEASV